MFNKKMMNEDNINYWAKKIRKIDILLSNELNEDRNIGFINLEKYKLPHYKKVTMKLCDFLENPKNAIYKIRTKKYFVSLIPISNDLDRFGKSDLDFEQVINYINQKINIENMKYYNIVLNQHFEHIYGGCLVIGNSNELYCEFKEGNQIDIARGKVIPSFFVIRNIFTKCFYYSFENIKLRELIFNTILAIPHTGIGREMKFLTGYFEFILIRKGLKNKLEPVFIDFRDNKIYNLDWRSEIVKSNFR